MRLQRPACVTGLTRAVSLCGTACLFAAFLATAGLITPCFAQPDYLLNATPVGPAKADPAIARALKSIEPGRIEADIQALVGFGTRSTLSSMEKDLAPGQGVTAAADWIAGQFEEISKGCGGCLEVRRDTFVQPVSERVTQPTTLTNVFAILKGADPAQAKRMVLVTGHYDSRRTDVMDARGAAPGANDDASGVAVSLESARALSKLHLASTVVFVAVAG